MSDNPLEDLSVEEQKALSELARARVNGSMTRRDMMKLGGLLGGGALLGGAGSQAIGTAEAAASNSDSDGDVGSPSNPIDVFADGVDAASVQTDNINTNEIWSSWGDIYPATDSGADQAIQDLNAEGSGEGIILPPNAFTVDTSPQLEAQKFISGWGPTQKATLSASGSVSGAFLDLLNNHYLANLLVDASKNTYTASDEDSSQGSVGTVIWNNVRFRDSTSYSVEITQYNPFKWKWNNVDLENGFKITTIPSQCDSYAGTYRPPDVDNTYSIHLGGGSWNFYGGNIFASDRHSACVFLDNTSNDIEGPTFDSNYVEWYTGTPAFQLGASGAGNNVSARIVGQKLKNNENLNNGEPFLINALQGTVIDPNIVKNANNVYNVNTGESKFQRGILSGVFRDATGIGPTISTGFGTEMTRGDMKNYGGTWTT